MGKKKSGTRFSLSSVLPTAWFPKLRWGARDSSQSTSTSTCRYANPCTGGQNNSELSFPRLSVGEERFHGSDDYMRCRPEEYELPRSSCGSCRLSVSTAEVAPIFTEILAEAKRSAVETGGTLPLPDTVKVPDREYRFPREEEKQMIRSGACRSPVEVVAVGRREFPANDSVSFPTHRGTLDETLLDPVLLPETASTVDLRPRNRNGFFGENHPSPESVPSQESVPLPEARRTRNCEVRDRSKIGDFLGPHLVLLPRKEVGSVDGRTESVVHAQRSIATKGETFQAKEPAKLREMERAVRDWTACTGSEIRLAGEFQNFRRDDLRVLQQRERHSMHDARKEAEDVTNGHVDADPNFLKGKVDRFPSLYSILFPEEESPQIVASGGDRTNSSGSIKPGINDIYSELSSVVLSERESMPNKKPIGEFAAGCARAEMHSANESGNFPSENYCHFQETGCKTRCRGLTRSIGSEVDLVAGKFGNSLSTDSVVFPNEVKNAGDMEDGADVASDCMTSEVQQSTDGRVEQSPVRETVLFPEKIRAKSMCRRRAEAELSTRTFDCDTPRRRSFKGRRKLKNGRVVLRGDNEKSPGRVQGFRTEEERKEFELKIAKILGFDPKTLKCGNPTAKELNIDFVPVSGNSVPRNSGSSDPKNSSDRRSPEVDRQNCARKPCDRKTGKENEFKSLLLRKLDRKKSDLMQNSRIQQPRDPEAPKAKQRPKVRVSSPRVEIRARKSFQSERRKKERAAAESFAVVKRSFDPQEDFRESMMEMISQNGIGKPEELESLLASYLSLNSDEHHDVIVKVFRQVWFDLSRACLVSDYLDLEGNRRAGSPNPHLLKGRHFGVSWGVDQASFKMTKKENKKNKPVCLST